MYLKQIISKAEEWIAAYSSSFHNEDQEAMWGIRLKEAHIGFVRRNCRELAQWLQLNEHDVLLAELIGLLHDVGRFRQWQLYKTFVDAKSEDHADLGVKVIQELPFYDLLGQEEKDLVLFAIKNHNKKEIAPAPDKRHLLFAKIIRDADKLDIFRVLAPYLTANPDAEGQSAAIRKFMKGPNGDATGEMGVFAPGFLEKFVRGEQVDYTMIRTNEDRKLVRLMWVYDVNYAWTLQRIRDKGYIEAIIANLPDSEMLRQGVERLQKYVSAKCASPDIA